MLITAKNQIMKSEQMNEDWGFAEMVWIDIFCHKMWHKK